MVKNCDLGLENVARGCWPMAAFSSPMSQNFTIWTDPRPVNNLFIFFPHGQRYENPDCAKNQLDCRICYHDHLKKIIIIMIYKCTNLALHA